MQEVETPLPSPGREQQPFSAVRTEVVQKATKEWTAALFDLGGRNNLLHYRDLRLGTLDLTMASPPVLGALLQGKKVRTSALFRHPEAQDANLRRVRTLHNKSTANFEEKGLETLSLACGLATWDKPRAAWQPCAPVLLCQASLRPLGAAQDDFELALTEGIEVNPTLLHALRVDFDCKVDPDALLDRIEGAIDEPWELNETYDWMTEQARRVPGFSIDRRLVLANFAYARLPMVRDLENATEQLVANELIAALAGDEQCRRAIRDQWPAPGDIPSPDEISPEDEFLVLDADSSQNYAINGVLAGHSLIIKGPPGTGKSQTIANLIASLVARNETVLFVAEKRAAIDVVTKRLAQHRLGELVLDLHGAVISRRAFAQEIGRALERSRQVPATDDGASLHQLERRRSELNAYATALHRTREPWGISIFQARAELIGLQSASNSFRLRGRHIENLGGQPASQIEEALADYVRLGGLRAMSGRSPWSQSSVADADEVQVAFAALDDVLHVLLPRAFASADRIGDAVPFLRPETVADWTALGRAWRQAHDALALFRPEVFDLDLEAVCSAVATAQRGGLTRTTASLFSPSYRRARAALRPLRVGNGVPPDRTLCAEARVALEALRAWRQLGEVGRPWAPATVVECAAAFDAALEGIRKLERWLGRTDVADMRRLELLQFLEALAADRATLVNLPTLRTLSATLLSAGITDYLSQLDGTSTAETAVRGFRYAWMHSIADHVALTDPVIGGFAVENHQTAVEDFKQRDRSHLERTPARVRRAWAERVVAAREKFKDQAALVMHQASLKRRHLPVRDLVRNAPDVLLALKPCWVMSPLVVSELLPSQPYFDVVIFDEASQVRPADAVCSIIRGKRVVVAGDEKQLPPTAFFEADGSDLEDSDDVDEEAARIVEPSIGSVLSQTGDFESILEALRYLLPFRMLQWHYRSRDERLIAFSNAHLYDRMLTTFAGIGETRVLEHHMVPWSPGADTNSPMPEVEAVVDLILAHARQRPNESLGVITMGIKHANRIEECLQQWLRQDTQLTTELEDFLDESREERFFVKNLERVQGDERDAIILSIGYGKNARGDLPYRFGPLLLDGGERRLNVAVTRAKNRITVVSSFAARDMDPERSDAPGVSLLRQYLQYVESDGTNLGESVADKPVLNPFEVDVRDTLRAHGLSLSAQYGASGYWIDFAVRDPSAPGHYVLAIECDGATYHSSESARDRDRLRQEHLERLGWTFHRIWSSEWFQNKEEAIGKVIAAYKHALSKQRDGSDGGVPPQPLGSRTVEADPPVRRAERAGRPPVRPGLRIDEYDDRELVMMALWVESDERLRTEDEVVHEVMRSLGFVRHGRVIVERLTRATRRARSMQSSKQSG